MRLFRRSVIRAKTIIRNSFTGVLVVFAAVGALCQANDSAWQSAAANLAEQISGATGPTQAHLTVLNLSSISAADVPTIRRMVEQSLKSRGVIITSDENTPAVRLTLSENSRECLWIAEVTHTRGAADQAVTKVVMVRVATAPPPPLVPTNQLILRKQLLLTSAEPILSALEVPGGFLALEPQQIEFIATPTGTRIAAANVPQTHPTTRDPQGIIASSGSNAFGAWLPGMRCEGALPDPQSPASWKIQCAASDDPWPLVTGEGTKPLKAFHNSSRDYFTGIVVPPTPTELPPFYSASLLPRNAGAAALLLTATDGRVLLLDLLLDPLLNHAQLQPVSGAADWGSDTAVLITGCGQGAQLIASDASAPTTDSLRAYDITGANAASASLPLAMAGPVIALWAAPDAKSIFAGVRHPAAPGISETYEVDRVTANCN